MTDTTTTTGSAQGEEVDPRYRDASLPVAERVEILLGQMTLEEKAGLFFQTMITSARAASSPDTTRCSACPRPTSTCSAAA